MKTPIERALEALIATNDAANRAKAARVRAVNAESDTTSFLSLDPAGSKEVADIRLSEGIIAAEEAERAEKDAKDEAEIVKRFAALAHRAVSLALYEATKSSEISAAKASESHEKASKSTATLLENRAQAAKSLQL